jgi:hypothetical protein
VGTEGAAGLGDESNWDPDEGAGGDRVRKGLPRRDHHRGVPFSERVDDSSFDGSVGPRHGTIDVHDDGFTHGEGWTRPSNEAVDS